MERQAVGGIDPWRDEARLTARKIADKRGVAAAAFVEPSDANG